MITAQDQDLKTLGCEVPLDDPAGWWMSEKLDGVRARWDGQRLMTRTGRPINCPARFTADLPPSSVEGELWGGRGTFQSTSGIVGRREPGLGFDWDGIMFMLFDRPHVKTTFAQRLAWLNSHVPASQDGCVAVIKQEICTGWAHLHRFLANILGASGEGIMLRSQHGQEIIKVKPVRDLDAEVIGYTQGRGRNSGRVGAIVARLANGLHFKIGTGLSDSDRNAPPPIGVMIKVAFDSLTQRGVPRFPRYLGARVD